jgi:hypothetical protein
MKIKIEYIDSNSLASDEVVANMKKRFGDSASVTVLPDSLDTFNLMYFAIQNYLTDRQLEAYFHEHQLYSKICSELLDEVLELATEVTMKVLRDNERRLE